MLEIGKMKRCLIHSLSAMPVAGLDGINANVIPFSSVFDKMQ